VPSDIQQLVRSQGFAFTGLPHHVQRFQLFAHMVHELAALLSGSVGKCHAYRRPSQPCHADVALDLPFFCTAASPRGCAFHGFAIPRLGLTVG
jgi:hypothetical protein